MKFTKMQGIGNDYVYVNCFENTVEHPADVARLISDRHFGIGADGMILIFPSETADAKMIMYNSDGSQSEMCGNGIRCVGKYIYDRGLTDKTEVKIETLGGIKTMQLHLDNSGTVRSITVDMGLPELTPAKIPVLAEGDSFIDRPVDVGGKIECITAVSMGNPHAIVYVDDVDSLNLKKVGPLFEHHELFPQRTNTEFIQVIDRNTLKMRVWERGAGETLACGTGACASLVASVLNGKCNREATLKLLGGDLIIRWDPESGHVYMTGPATFVFDGEIQVENVIKGA